MAREAAVLGLVVASLTGLVYLAIMATRGPGAIALLWSAGSVALVYAGQADGQRRGWRIGAALAAFAAGNLLAGNSLPRSAIFTAANGAELLVGLALIRRLNWACHEVHELRGLARFVFGVAVPAPIAGGLIAAVGMYVLSGAPPYLTFERFYLSHVLGLCVVAPFLLSVSRDLGEQLRRRAPEALVLLAGVAVTVFLAFGTSRTLGFIVYPVLLLAAVRFRVAGAATAVLMVAAVSMAVLLHNGAGLDAGALHDKLRTLQLYLLLGCIPTPFVAAVLNERDRLATEAAQGRALAEAANAGKSRLLANVSHEVRTPLNAVMNLSEMVLQEQLGPLTAQQKDVLRTVVASAAMLVALANDLTDVAKAESGALSVKPVRLDLRDTVGQVLGQLAPQIAAAGAEVRLDLPDTPLMATADPLRLAQILTNLLTNAVKYAGGDGPILVAASTHGGLARLEVRDSGPGIPDHLHAELFEPFNRLGKEAGRIEGTGIGLALARRLAEMQGGAVDFDSAPGQGSRFWVTVPAG